MVTILCDEIWWLIYIIILIYRKFFLKCLRRPSESVLNKVAKLQKFWNFFYLKTWNLSVDSYIIFFFFFFWPYYSIRVLGVTKISHHFFLFCATLCQSPMLIFFGYSVTPSIRFFLGPQEGRFSIGFRSKATLKGSFPSLLGIWLSHWILRPSMKSFTGAEFIISYSSLLYFPGLTSYVRVKHGATYFSAYLIFQSSWPPTRSRRCSTGFTTAVGLIINTYNLVLDLLGSVLELRNFSNA